MNDDIEEIEIDVTAEDEDSFIRYDIATYPSDLTIQVLKGMWDNDDILIPDFQRNYVWTIKQASLLIESFLLGLPVPQAFFYIDREHKNLVIDGQQRIISLILFLSGFFGDEDYQGRRQVFRLTGLSEKSPFKNKRFTDLEEKDQRKLSNSVLRVVNIRQRAPKEDDTAAFHIFERLNTGGTPLKAQEIRNSVFHGPIVTELNALNRNANWRKILGRKSLDKHQRDVEMILRVFAMYEHPDKYEKPMKEFLNVSMKENRAAKAKKFIEFKERFFDVCEKIVLHFGEKPFHIRGPINLAALDSIMCECVKNYDGNFELAKLKYDELINSTPFRDSIFFNTSDASVVRSRMNDVKSLFIS